MKSIDTMLITQLTVAAHANQRLRQHYNFHDNHDDPCQRLLVAIAPGSYIQPHRHFVYPKNELFVIVQGKVGVIIFSEPGGIMSVEILEAGGQVLGCEIPAGIWHTVIALKDSVCLEVKAGPYKPLPEGDRGSWAPVEGAQEARLYLEQLRIRAECSIQ